MGPRDGIWTPKIEPACSKQGALCYKRLQPANVEDRTLTNQISCHVGKRRHECMYVKQKETQINVAHAVGSYFQRVSSFAAWSAATTTAAIWESLTVGGSAVGNNFTRLSLKNSESKFLWRSRQAATLFGTRDEHITCSQNVGCDCAARGWRTPL